MIDKHQKTPLLEKSDNKPLKNNDDMESLKSRTTEKSASAINRPNKRLKKLKWTDPPRRTREPLSAKNVLNH